jgi:hypothetical protein
MGSCVSKPEPHYVFRTSDIPGITLVMAHKLANLTYRLPEEVWAKFQLCNSEFIIFMRTLHPTYLMFHIMNCIQFLNEVSNIIECADIRLKIAQAIFKNPAMYDDFYTTFNETTAYLQQFSSVEVNATNISNISGDFIRNIMMYLHTKGARSDVTFNVAFVKMMKNRAIQLAKTEAY